ncbi:MAG TPA: flavodoxin-dependent (E)-4-hydroxy-3-methylbut-2-enyl-diphosphate synthase [Candidatus Krumholzibacterium sp.]|nr:flavodoxin-dependent (E)-4-hydroxy-3-methylbut-2-enyl-diphosphate synthase [Candidatus Krumholzibacterium sp.]
MIARRKTRKVYYGKVGVGGDAPVSIQSMSTFPASSEDEVLAQIKDLHRAGCQIVRVSVKDRAGAASIRRLSEESPIPVIADVHFDHMLAVESARQGAAGLRINPGNIGDGERVLEVIAAASQAGIPIRVGINSGSLERDLHEMASADPAGAMCESAARALDIFERAGFGDVVLSLKSSDPAVTVRANEVFAGGSDIPLHIGVTEAGPELTGTARSVAALTTLLNKGIGDTVRISLSGDPVSEVLVAGAMLSALGLRGDLPRVVSCPTCGRCHIDVARIAGRLERLLPADAGPIRVAVMGCEVNGPGEARDADVGVAGAKNGAILFRGGKVAGKIEGDVLEALLGEIERLRVKET